MLYFDCSCGSMDDLLAMASDFHRQGVMILRGAFDPAFVDTLAEYYFAFHHPRRADPRYPYRLAPLGPGRTHVTLELHQAWNDPRLYANRWLYPWLQRMLGPDFVMPTFAVALSQPGAGPQYIHRDQPWLFDEPALNDPLPPCSITVSVPLVDLDERVGSTEFRLGSHRPADAAGMAEREPIAGVPFTPAWIRRGDCVLWDSRTIHRGMPNRSERMRPIVLSYFQRPWFFNHSNFDPGVALPFTDHALGRVASQHRHLFELIRRMFPRPVYEGSAGQPCPCGGPWRYEDCHAPGAAPFTSARDLTRRAAARDLGA